MKRRSFLKILAGAAAAALAGPAALRELAKPAPPLPLELASIDFEEFVRAEMAKSMAEALDSYAINGPGFDPSQIRGESPVTIPRELRAKTVSVYVAPYRRPRAA